MRKFVVVLGAVSTFIFLPLGAKAMTISGLISLVNAERTNAGLGKLTSDSKLQAAAQVKVEDMVTRNYFAHDTPEGKTPWDFLAGVGYQFKTAGENLAVSTEIDNEALIVQGWMNSPAHRAILMDGRHTETGIGIAIGTYQGRRAVYISEFFGSPRETAPVVVVPIQPPTQPVTQQPAAQQVVRAEPKVITPPVTQVATQSVTIKQAVKQVVNKIVETPVVQKAEANEAGQTTLSTTITTAIVSTSTPTHVTVNTTHLAWFERLKLFLSKLFSRKLA